MASEGPFQPKAFCDPVTGQGAQAGQLRAGRAGQSRRGTEAG